MNLLVLIFFRERSLYEKLRWLSYRDRQSQHAIILEILERALDDVKVPDEVQE